MADIIKEWRKFDEGIRGDLDSPFHQHFDIFTDPRRLIPYRSTQTDHSTNVSSTDAKQYDIRNFQLGSDGKLYGLGKNGSSQPKVLKKTDPTTGNWLSSAGNNAATVEGEGNGARITGCFIEWQSAMWFFQGTTQLAKCTLAGTITNTVLTVGTVTTVAQGVVGADDNLYLFYNNKVVRVNNAGTATDSVLSNLPSNMRITSACRWGSYIAIGMAFGTSATAAPSGASKVFIWDMVSTTTVTEVVDWGEGALLALGTIEGRIVGVSNKYLETPSGLTSLAVAQGSMVVRVYSGAQAQVYREIVGNQVVTLGRFIQDVVVKDNKMYWVASVPFGASTSTESTYHLGIWAFGRKDRNSDFSLSLDYIEESVDTSNYKINSFGNAGNYWFINHSADGSIHKVDSSANYTFTSIYETEHFGNEKQSLQLKAAFIVTDFLPSGAVTVLKYKKDSETSFTQIFTFSTANSLRHTALGLENLTAGGDTVTMTIASPGVITLTAHKLVAGQQVTFTTTGALPTGITAGNPYFVLSAGLAANTFRIATSAGGTAINTSGSQSGTHTMDRTIPLPQFKRIILRAESTGGAVITGVGLIAERIDDDVV